MAAWATFSVLLLGETMCKDAVSAILGLRTLGPLLQRALSREEGSEDGKGSVRAECDCIGILTIHWNPQDCTSDECC